MKDSAAIDQINGDTGGTVWPRVAEEYLKR
jgi:hypothetical protein